MSDVIGSKAQGLLDSLDENTKPAVVEMARKLKKYVEAEKGLAAAVNTMRLKASGLIVYSLTLKDWASKNKGPDADAFKKRAKDFDKAIGGLESFADALDALLEGGRPAKTKLPGAALQKVLDDLEFKDKAQVTPVRKAALDYYPAESAGQKKLQEWAVHLSHLCGALNEGLAELDPSDRIDQVNLEFGRNEVLKRAIELKKSIDTLGV